MNIRKRLPDRQDIYLVFLGCVFIIHIWAVANLFYTMPAWLLRMKLGQLVGSTAYVLTFALVESSLVLGVLVLLTIIFPKAFFRERFVSQSSGLVLVSAIFSIILHFNYAFLVTQRVLILGLAALFLIIALVTLYWTGKSNKFDNISRATLERLSLLSGIYLFIDVIAVLIVFARNILG